MNNENDRNVVVRLEILVPQGGQAATVSAESRAFGLTPAMRAHPGAVPPMAPLLVGNNANINYPLSTGNTPARNGQWICAYGDNTWETTSSGARQKARHVFAYVYEGLPLVIPDEPPSGCLWTRPINHDPANWQFLEVRIPALGMNTLVIWADYDGSIGYTKSSLTFTAVHATDTYCGMYYPMVPPAAPVLHAVARTLRWKFTLSGVANQGCGNCSFLNKTWIVELDNSQPVRQRWLCALPQSFACADTHAYWRLELCRATGNYFLDCVQHPDVALGTWISYRCHESHWKPSGPNEMTLHTSSNYCQMPSTITLTPA